MENNEIREVAMPKMAYPTEFSHEWWTTEHCNDKSSEWEQALCSYYRNWELTKPVGVDFRGQLRKQPIDEIAVVECICDPCSGRRITTRSDIKSDAVVGFQAVVSGSERFYIGGKTITVGIGDVLLWNSYDETAFEILQPLHKLTILIPQALLASRLETGKSIQGGMVDSRTGAGALFHSHIRSLGEQFNAIPTKEVYGIKWSSIELAAAAAMLLQQPMSTQRQARTRRIQNYILENLHDPDLCLHKLANDNGISVRYLHSLFTTLGTTVSHWIMERRLERCRDALAAQCSVRGVVKHVAFRWGFNDVTHFSRVFKKRYGLSPLEFATVRTLANNEFGLKAPPPSSS